MDRREKLGFALIQFVIFKMVSHKKQWKRPKWSLNSTTSVLSDGGLRGNKEYLCFWCESYYGTGWLDFNE